MAFTIAVNTRFAGTPKGLYLNDLTAANPPSQVTANKIMSKIVVYAGGIIDSVRITYNVENAPTPLTVQHGGPGGHEVLSFDIAADEKLVAVYGTQLVNPSPWKERHIIQLSFIVVKSAGDAPTTKVYTATGNYIAPTVKFELSFPLTTASSYTFEPQGGPVSYLEGLGFSNVLSKAD